MSWMHLESFRTLMINLLVTDTEDDLRQFAVTVIVTHGFSQLYSLDLFGSRNHHVPSPVSMTLLLNSLGGGRGGGEKKIEKSTQVGSKDSFSPKIPYGLSSSNACFVPHSLSSSN
ncbi:hypothetical protein CEXT_165091 [Caerostris extrusa]|uniref:Uncharacterized protein n=1 Tax=Caerostris extrusa TaxID=172846 RepID=A0AAV4QCT3_CAEEX|nr:hypothetical protein CEXT_165091 [Caerostris extrusa]